MILTSIDISVAASVASREADALGYSTPCDRGHVLQRERLALYAERCCEAMPGDLIELGSYSGVTSAMLAGIARKHHRTLVCIDDFKDRKGFSHAEAATEFQRVLRKNGDIIEWHCIDAHSLEAVKAIQKRKYCFAFADAGHDLHEAFFEMVVLMEVTDGVICKDDCYLAHMTEAIRFALKVSTEWELLSEPRLSEWYLQRREK